MTQKTFSPSAKSIDRQWYLIDASTLNLGRLATEIAKLLLGKNKANYAHHIDVGDYVIVVNSNKLKVTGNKLETVKYYAHSMHPSGLRTRTLQEQLKLDSTKVIEHAVRGMLPRNRLLSERLNRLKVYAEDQHNHSAQQPKTLTLN